MKISQIEQLMQFAISTKKAVVLSGPPGIGKTESIETWARINGRKCVTLPLSTVDSIDLRGVLVPGNDGTSAWLPPAGLKELSEKAGVLFLDELSQCNPAVLTAALRILAEREVGELKLHPDTVVVGGMNDIDEGGAFKLPSLITNRVAIFRCEADMDSWASYIQENDPGEGAAITISFLKRQVGAFSEAPKEEGVPFATPRAWHGVVRALNANVPLMEEGIMGLIGEGRASELMTFRKNLDLPELEKVLDGKWTPDPERLDVCFVVAQMLVGAALEKGSKKINKVWDALRKMADTPGILDIAIGAVSDIGHSKKKVDIPNDLFEKAAVMIY